MMDLGRRDNSCGAMSPDGRVGCTRIFLHIEVGPCRNVSAGQEWCAMCDAYACPHLETWREAAGREATADVDALLREPSD